MGVVAAPACRRQSPCGATLSRWRTIHGDQACASKRPLIFCRNQRGAGAVKKLHECTAELVHDFFRASRSNAVQAAGKATARWRDRRFPLVKLHNNTPVV